MAKRKVVNAPTVDTNRPTIYAKFGWCSTGQCKECRVEFTGHRCSCECHGKEESNDGEDRD